MRIYDIFKHQIDRDYKGVINVAQDDLHNVRQELEEYVVTRELQRHFREFFRAYSRSIGRPHEKIGVWISGFFGSGKSHLLKILSYLLENRMVGDKPAIGYFTDAQKIADATVIADIHKAGSTPSDIILFNIGAEADTTTQGGQDTITSVFLRVFNEHLGYCASMPFLADLERSLEGRGHYAAFKQAFEAIEGRSWEEARDEFFFIQDALVQALVAADNMSEAAARNTVEKAGNAYEMSTADFAGLVKKYLAGKEADHHLVFMADEVGQFISSNSQMMLNLQNIVEDLGRICQGRAWVVVTSQQDMGKTLEHMRHRNDFSRIQDRFETRLSLTAANADEVVRQRVLQKKDTAASSLSIYHGQNAVVLKNLLTFKNAATMPLYAGAASFVSDYPFIPYQFDLMGLVLTAIRENAATGLNLSHGERSQLHLFMKSAIALKEEQIGVLAPVPLFYEAMRGFVDSVHATVINRAEEGNALEAFDVQLLKLLFMIKYIKEIPGNIDNLTTMMVTRVDEDRLALGKKVAAGLEHLIRETLIHRSGEVYTFLTNEEQDINRAISREIAEMGEVNAYLAREVFESIYRDRRYRHSARYNFDFNRLVDGAVFGAPTSDKLGINVLTPYSDARDDQAMRMQSSQNNVVLVSLPTGNDRLIEEITHTIKLEKYLRRHSVDLSRNHPGIQGEKEAELRAMKDRILGMLKDAVSQADIYVRGEKLNIPAREPADRLNEALGRQVQHLYFRLGDMESSPGQSDIEALLVQRGQTQFALDQQAPNHAALQDMVQTLELLSRQSMVRTTLKTLLDRYMKEPYGFVPLDVQWLVAWLFAHGKVTLSYNNQTLALGQTPRQDLVNYLIRQEHRDKLVIEPRLEVPQEHKQAAEEFMRGWFNQTTFPGNEDQFMQEFRLKAEARLRTIEPLERYYISQPDLPGKDVLIKAQELLRQAARNHRAADFFRHLYDTKDAWQRQLSRLTPAESFLTGEQRPYFEKALLYRKLFNESSAYITSGPLIRKMGDIESVLRLEAPYGEIYRLPPMLEEYGSLHTALLEQEDAPVRRRIEEDRQAVLDRLEASPLKEAMLDEVLSKYSNLLDRLSRGQSVQAIRNLAHESDATKINLFHDIDTRESKIVPPPPLPDEPNHREGRRPTAMPVRRPVYRHISMRNLVSASVTLTTPQQVDAYVGQLRSKLLEQLNNGDVDGINLVL